MKALSLTGPRPPCARPPTSGARPAPRAEARKPGAVQFPSEKDLRPDDAGHADSQGIDFFYLCDTAYSCATATRTIDEYPVYAP